MRGLLIILFVFTFSVLFSQEKNVESSHKTEKELLFFSNDGCGKCAKAQAYFETHQMPFEKLAIRENRPLMYEFVHKKTKGAKVGVSYPVLVYGDSIYFNFPNIDKVLKEIKTLMTEDGLILKEE